MSETEKKAGCGCNCQSKFVDQANSITTLVMRFNELDKDIRDLENEKSSKMSMIADDLLQLETRICRIEDELNATGWLTFTPIKRK